MGGLCPMVQSDSSRRANQAVSPAPPARPGARDGVAAAARKRSSHRKYHPKCPVETVMHRQISSVPRPSVLFRIRDSFSRTYSEVTGSDPPRWHHRRTIHAAVESFSRISWK
jgi:hypothetical protein